MLLTTSAILLIAAAAHGQPADAVPVPIEDPIALAAMLWDAVSSRNWRIVSATVIAGGLWTLRRFWKQLPTDYLPLFAVLAGGGSGYVAAVMAGKPILAGIVSGMNLGFVAPGLRDAVVKSLPRLWADVRRILPKPPAPGSP